MLIEPLKSTYFTFINVFIVCSDTELETSLLSSHVLHLLHFLHSFQNIFSLYIHINLNYSLLFSNNSRIPNPIKIPKVIPTHNPHKPSTI